MSPFIWLFIFSVQREYLFRLGFINITNDRLRLDFLLQFYQANGKINDYLYYGGIRNLHDRNTQISNSWQRKRGCITMNTASVCVLRLSISTPMSTSPFRSLPVYCLCFSEIAAKAKKYRQ